MAENQRAPGAADAAPAEETVASLIDDILGETTLKPTDEGYDVTRKGVQAFLTELLTPAHAKEKVDRAFADSLIAEIDAKLSLQLDAILHQPEFQELESAWRGLKFAIDRIDFRENIRCDLLNCSKEDLILDFEDAPEIMKSGLYRTVYTAEYGQFGGKPYGAIMSNYEIEQNPQDLTLLQKCAAVATMAHAPFFAAATPTFFGGRDFHRLPNMKDLKAHFEGPQFTKWHSFRESEDARYVGLLMPKFLLRLPYGEETTPVRSFNYVEQAVGDHTAYLWGNATFAFATRLADSFGKYRWCANIIGPQSGGAVEDLPLHQYEAMGEIETKIPTEIMLSERREFELSEEGFIALTFRKGSDNAAFFSANSCQKPKYYGQSEKGRDAELNYRLGTQFPYMFMITRLAHYIKVLQREQIGSFKERLDLQRELSTWIEQYVVDMDHVSPRIRGERPFRMAKVEVEDVPGNAGWYKVDIKVRPHFKYMGAFFTLGLVGKLDKA
jgi:type VI secretion system protein ImpC